MRDKQQRRIAETPPRARPFEPRLPPATVEVARAQPALADLVRAETRELGPAVTDLGLALAQIVLSQVAGDTAPARCANRAQVRAVFKQMTTLLYNLDSADPALVERALATAHSPQPELMQALERLLLEHQNSGQYLDNKELGVLYVIARTAVAVLHDLYKAPGGLHASWD
jgi:hypothetical protein